MLEWLKSAGGLAAEMESWIENSPQPNYSGRRGMRDFYLLNQVWALLAFHTN